MAQRSRALSLECAFCGIEFPNTRSDKRFCCDNHRQAYLRWNLKLSAHEIRGNHTIHSVADYLAYPESRQTALAVLDALEKLIVTVRAEYFSEGV